MKMFFLDKIQAKKYLMRRCNKIIDNNLQALNSRGFSKIQVKYLFQNSVIFWGGGNQKITLDYRGEV